MGYVGYRLEASRWSDFGKCGGTSICPAYCQCHGDPGYSPVHDQCPRTRECCLSDHAPHGSVFPFSDKPALSGLNTPPYESWNVS